MIVIRRVRGPLLQTRILSLQLPTATDETMMEKWKQHLEKTGMFSSSGSDRFMVKHFAEPVEYNPIGTKTKFEFGWRKLAQHVAGIHAIGSEDVSFASLPDHQEISQLTQGNNSI